MKNKAIISIFIDFTNKYAIVVTYSFILKLKEKKLLFILFIVGVMMIFYGSGCACAAATDAFNPVRSQVDVLNAVEKISKAVPLVAFGTAFVTASIVLIFK